MMLADPLFAGLAEGLKPKPRLKLSEWAEANLVLPPERSASPGPYRIGDAVFQRGMMDAITDPDNEDIVFITSSQVGKTTI
ncbi:phage terminase large subunit family protein, partial [Citrobacter koseri]